MIVERLIVGMYGTNCYLAVDEETKLAAVIDPGDDAEEIAAAAEKQPLSSAGSGKGIASSFLTAVISYISEHFCEPLSLEILSKELGVCRFYLSRIFTQVLHTGFHEYVNTLRIDQAKKLLENTRDSILDVAIQCGFQNQQTFNRVFKEICGITPSAFRKNTE